MKPIKKRLLIHDVTVKSQTDESSWKKEYSTDISVTNVLVQLVISNNDYQNGNEMVKGNALLFYDYKNSSNTGALTPQVLFTLGNIVEFNGREFHVLNFEDTLGYEDHHLEVILL